ncbi:MAG: hypothetical protein IKF19_06050 [Bacilli bacterium]|nr:hypothetical protein [Bacilli bacterium]
MEKMLITNINGRNIYIFTDDKISFYISMPNMEFNNTNIAINLIDNTNNINIANSNNELIKEEITKIYNNFHQDDFTIITPVLDSNLTEQIKLNNDEKIFNYTDRIISYLINCGYKILTNENIQVNNIIKLVNNPTYNDFNKWFINKYNGRVELIESNNNTLKQESEVPNDISVSSEEKNIANEVLENTNTINAIKDNEMVPEEKTRDLGFVSYVLLGVVVAVISLVILYMIV